MAFNEFREGKQQEREKFRDQTPLSVQGMVLEPQGAREAYNDQKILEDYSDFFASLNHDEQRLRYYTLALAQWQYLHFGQQTSRYWSMQRTEFDIRLKKPTLHIKRLVLKPLELLREKLESKEGDNLYVHAEGYVNQVIRNQLRRIEFSNLKRDAKIQKAQNDMVTILNNSCLPVFMGGDLLAIEIKDPRLLDIMANQLPELQEVV